MIQRILEAGKVFAAVVILVAGFWGVVITFSDYPDTWSVAAWMAYVAGWHVPGGFLVGFLVPKRWYLSVLVAWGAAGMLLIFAPYLIAPILAVAMCAGYLGSLVSRWYTRRKSATGI